MECAFRPEVQILQNFLVPIYNTKTYKNSQKKIRDATKNWKINGWIEYTYEIYAGYVLHLTYHKSFEYLLLVASEENWSQVKPRLQNTTSSRK